MQAIYLFGIKQNKRAAVRAAFAGRPAAQIILQGAEEIDIEPLVARVTALHQSPPSAPHPLSAKP